MKILYLLLPLFLLLKTANAQTPVYLNFVSHNETSDPLEYDHPTNPAFYNQIKALAQQVCDTIITKQAKLNMQVDANFIKGCLLHDNAAASPDDFLEWANNSAFIDVDGHNHFDVFQNPYNYADLAYLLDSCGVVLNNNILGGVTWKNPGENWTQYQSPVAGFTFTNFSWQADFVWGPATPGHVDDYEAFGIWKPAGPTDMTFGQHSPFKKLTSIGGGCKDGIGFVLDNTGKPRYYTHEIIANLKDQVDFINAIPPPPNAFFTANMLINFRDMPQVPNFADSIAVIINGIQDYVDEGKIVWLTLAEKHDLWLANHPDPNDFFLFQCDDVVSSAEEEVAGTPVLEVFPNPTSGEVTLRTNLQEAVEWTVSNALGQVVFYEKMLAQETSIDLSGLPQGLYFISLKTKDGQVSSQTCLKK